MHENSRYMRPWARSQLRKSRGLLAVTVTIVTIALFSTLRYLSRAGYLSLKAVGFGHPLWSYAYVNASARAFPPHNPAYLIIQPPLSFRSNESLGKVRTLPSECLDSYFATGQLCHAGPDPPLDVIWTWANGSDRLFKELMAKAVGTTNPKLPSTSRANTQLFRDHDELRHSIRSVLRHFAGYTKQLYIMTSDFSIPIPVMDGDKLYNGTHRLGLVPHWLDPERSEVWRDGDVHLQLKHHSEIFRAYNGSSFNSYGIESQLANMQNISDNFIYMNDDFFMTADLSPSDFYSSAYGTVLRIQADLLVKNTDNPKGSVAGEWAPLEFTNWCLSKRFGSRRRPYTTHAAKSLSIGVMKEFSHMWQAELTVTASHPFRGMKEGHRDVYSMFLFAHFLVERWREGLLWSWAVGKIGGLGEQWGAAEKERAWLDLGGRPGDSVLQVVSTRRTTVNEIIVRKNLQAAGHVVSGKTKYVFASGDGYPYGYRNEKGALAWPSFSSSGEPICEIDYQECFEQPNVHSASDFFKSVAFDKNLQCGDCIVHALRAASGTSGLSAFLPDAERIHISTKKRGDGKHKSGDTILLDGPPHLPLVSDWRNGDFALQDVIASQGETNIRDWTLRMLERYRFVIGQTPTSFQQITSFNAARIKLKKVDDDKEVALLCLNDDIQGLTWKAGQLLLKWQEQRWGNKAQWER